MGCWLNRSCIDARPWRSTRKKHACKLKVRWRWNSQRTNQSAMKAEWAISISMMIENLIFILFNYSSFFIWALYQVVLEQRVSQVLIVKVNGCKLITHIHASFFTHRAHSQSGSLCQDSELPFTKCDLSLKLVLNLSRLCLLPLQSCFDLGWLLGFCDLFPGL